MPGRVSDANPCQSPICAFSTFPELLRIVRQIYAIDSARPAVFSPSRRFGDASDWYDIHCSRRSKLRNRFVSHCDLEMQEHCKKSRPVQGPSRIRNADQPFPDAQRSFGRMIRAPEERFAPFSSREIPFWKPSKTWLGSCLFLVLLVFCFSLHQCISSVFITSFLSFGLSLPVIRFVKSHSLAHLEISWTYSP